MSRPVNRIPWPPIEQAIAVRHDLAVRGSDEYEVASGVQAVDIASASAIAAIAGLSQRAIVRYRSAGTVPLRTVEDIADHIGVHPSELSGDYVDALIATTKGSAA